MKNYLLLTAVLLLSNFGHAQTQKASGRTPLQPMKSEATAATPKVAAADSLQGETIEHLDALIQAIDGKVAFVKSDQTENEKALASGWYDKMASTRARCVAKRQVLVARTTTK
jgi:hypothetical protein